MSRSDQDRLELSTSGDDHDQDRRLLDPTHQVTAAGGGPEFLGLLSFVGTLAYFWGSVSSSGEAVVAVLKALV